MSLARKLGHDLKPKGTQPRPFKLLISIIPVRSSFLTPRFRVSALPKATNTYNNHIALHSDHEDPLVVCTPILRRHPPHFCRYRYLLTITHSLGISKYSSRVSKSHNIESTAAVTVAELPESPRLLGNQFGRPHFLPECTSARLC